MAGAGAVDWEGWIGKILLVYFVATGVCVFAVALWSRLTVANPYEPDDAPLWRTLVGAVLFAAIVGAGAPFAFIYNAFERLFRLGVSGLRAVTGWPPAEKPIVYDAEFWAAERAREIAAGERDDDDDQGG